MIVTAKVFYHVTEIKNDIKNYCQLFFSKLRTEHACSNVKRVFVCVIQRISV